MKYINLVINRHYGTIIAAFESVADAMKERNRREKVSMAAYIKAGRPKYHTPHEYKVLTIPYFPKHIKKDSETNDLLIQEGY